MGSVIWIHADNLTKRPDSDKTPGYVWAMIMDTWDSNDQMNAKCQHTYL